MNRIFSDETEQNLSTVMKNVNNDLVSDPGVIFNILTESKLRGTAVGINAPTLGGGIYITAVEDIILDSRESDITIVIKNFDISGYIFETNKLKLAEIASVIPFKSEFKNPYIRNLGGSPSR